ncbi:hypothetical protein VC83_06288 [Pseudogymnoascus destructans]|uniref:Uncharacterized protein n=1 Tax=Pseudogymnoascus destructans TaxID=655981 RepID=A0A177AAN3_9PEZI|nr:uncharacterized protein VC83_06288 [Pseudogymnoascus destructans]OAF58820.1 hypothetical protein VC83_06288 [Pseudogymnoascus destructans]
MSGYEAAILFDVGNYISDSLNSLYIIAVVVGLVITALLIALFIIACIETHRQRKTNVPHAPAPFNTYQQQPGAYNPHQAPFSNPLSSIQTSNPAPPTQTRPSTRTNNPARSTQTNLLQPQCALQPKLAANPPPPPPGRFSYLTNNIDNKQTPIPQPSPLPPPSRPITLSHKHKHPLPNPPPLSRSLSTSHSDKPPWHLLNGSGLRRHRGSMTCLVLQRLIQQESSTAGPLMQQRGSTPCSSSQHELSGGTPAPGFTQVAPQQMSQYATPARSLPPMYEMYVRPTGGEGGVNPHEMR